MSKYTSYILYLLLSVLVVLLYVNDFGPLANLQRSIDDFLCEYTAPTGTRPNVAIVAIDGPSLDKYGNWPWNHDLLGDLSAAVATAEPKTIVVDFELSEDSYQDSAGYTDILAEQFAWIENAVLPYDIALSTYRTEKANNPEHLFDHSLTIANPLGLMDEGSSLLVRKVFLPATKLLANKPAIGFSYQMPDHDRLLRHQPLVMNYEGYYYPSVALLAAAKYLNVPVNQIKVTEGATVEIGSERTIPIDAYSQLYITYPDGMQYERFSAAQVLDEGFDLSRLKNKLVLIAVEDIETTQYFQTVRGNETPSYMIRASVIENIINDNMVAHSTNSAGITMLILFLVGGICAFVLPQVTVLYRTLILLGALVLLGNVSYVLISSFKVIGETVFIALELILFMVASPLLDSSLLSDGTEKEKSNKSKLPRVELEKPIFENAAPAKERTIVESPDDPANQQTKALASTGGTQSDGAHTDHQSIDIDGVDIASDATSAAPIDNSTIDPDSATGMIEDTNVGDHDGSFEPEANLVEPISDRAIPVSNNLTKLGRYEISGTLGKGAMGHVYKGVDPAINRPVALKTIRLDFITDPEEMEELKERLYREAQAAGKLSHPNIVTIYDVGSDGDLQYIAMEYLEGQTLEDMIKKKTKFNYKIVAQIMIQICSALQYAHERNIVHRDIKPANIMITKDYAVKVMDFGIARIDSNSMTKTGIAMGTPNYISPEQLQGQPVDAKADIFSLGVVLYELLIGKRPFKGENITSLIYSILNHEPQKPSNIKPQIPLLFDHIVDKTLRKDPQERYQNANEVITNLSEFVEAFNKA